MVIMVFSTDHEMGKGRRSAASGKFEGRDFSVEAFIFEALWAGFWETRILLLECAQQLVFQAFRKPGLCF